MLGLSIEVRCKCSKHETGLKQLLRNTCLFVYGRHNIGLERKIPPSGLTILHGSLSFLITQCITFITLISFDN